jgi:hypothetical protein
VHDDLQEMYTGDRDTITQMRKQAPTSLCIKTELIRGFTRPSNGFTQEPFR